MKTNALSILKHNANFFFQLKKVLVCILFVVSILFFEACRKSVPTNESSGGVETITNSTPLYYTNVSDIKTHTVADIKNMINAVNYLTQPQKSLLHSYIKYGVKIFKLTYKTKDHFTSFPNYLMDILTELQ